VKRAYGRETVLVVSLAVTAAVLLFVWVWVRTVQADAIPSHVRSSVNFPLYQPTQLPKGYKIADGSFRLNSSVVTFTVQNLDKSLVFTEQAKPMDFDFESFYTDQFANARKISTGAGRAYVNAFGDGELASIATDRTWILVRSPSGISAKDFDAILQGIKD
jgi:hypothetical protein